MRQRCLRLLVVLLPAGGALAAIVVGLARIAWPSQEYWAARGHLVVSAIVAGGLVPLALSSISEAGERLRRKQLEREDNIRAVLVSSLVFVARVCEAPWDLTGIQAFLVEGWLWRRHQVRVARVRLASAPESGVRWTNGKGVIGRCWETRSGVVVHLDEEPFSQLFTVPREEWETVPPDARFGLSFDDYQTLGGKYGTVVAVPIITRSGEYKGCVTLDMPPGLRLRSPARALESLAAAADLVRRLIGS